MCRHGGEPWACVKRQLICITSDTQEACAGPVVGGEHGPYRQSERRDVYKQYVDELVARGLAYPCFCTDEELEAMKRDAEAKGLPPIYRGRWARAGAEEVADMLAQVRRGGAAAAPVSLALAAGSLLPQPSRLQQAYVWFVLADAGLKC